MRDLAPYVCLIPGCDLPLQTFPTPDAWIAHMQNEHLPVEWFCVMHDTEYLFSSERDFVHHMQQEHHGTIVETGLEILKRVRRRRPIGIYQSCPFLDGFSSITDPSTNADRAEQAELLQHIGQHLRMFALLSIPEFIPLPVDSRSSSQAETRSLLQGIGEHFHEREQVPNLVIGTEEQEIDLDNSDLESHSRRDIPNVSERLASSIMRTAGTATSIVERASSILAVTPSSPRATPLVHAHWPPVATFGAEEEYQISVESSSPALRPISRLASRDFGELSPYRSPYGSQSNSTLHLRSSPSLSPSPRPRRRRTTRDSGESSLNRTPPHAPPIRPPLPPTEPTDWICDVCTASKANGQYRYHCTECDSYDLCMDCMIEGYVSKGHKNNHKMASVARRHAINVADICPCYDDVIPQYNPPRQQPNWTDEGDIRWIYLHGSPSHARFFVPRLSKGAYMCRVVITFKFSGSVNQTTLAEIRKTSLGQLKISLGSPLNTLTFLGTPKPEDATLNRQLFGFDSSVQFKITVPKSVEMSKRSWTECFDISSETTYLGPQAGSNSTNSFLGIVLQWSNTTSLRSKFGQVLLMALDKIVYEINSRLCYANVLMLCRMDKLFEYDNPPTHHPWLRNSPTVLSPPQRGDAQPLVPPSAATSRDILAIDQGGVDEYDGGLHDISFQELVYAADLLQKNKVAITSENILAALVDMRDCKTDMQVELLRRQISSIRDTKKINAIALREFAQRSQFSEESTQALLLGWLATEKQQINPSEREVQMGIKAL